MATVAGVKIKTKQAKTRNPIFFDEKYTGGEPAWDTERALSMTDTEFDHHLRRSFYYYNYYYSQKDTKKYVVEWMRTVKEYTKDDVKTFDRSADKSISMTACSLIMAHRAGMPLKERHVKFLNENIRAAIMATAPEVETVTTTTAVPEVYRPSIQDRLNERTSELIGEIEGHFDEVVAGNRVDFKPYDYLSSNNVPQSQLGKYEAVYTRVRSELEQAQAKADAQLVEGYRFLKATDFRRIYAFIDQLLAAIEQYRGVKKATKKARVKKAPSKEKVIAKLKYAKEHKELKLVSINPADIVGASELWVYNTKTRKLGRYIAGAYKTLTVKGASIADFDEQKSVAKTLRKPAEQLAEFARAGKVALRTFLRDIRATEILLNGRINADCVLLKAA